MAKWSNDLGLDAALDWFTDVDKMVICSQQPTTYAEANATYALADVAVDAGDFTKANGDVSGRKVTVAAQSGVTVDANGTGTHVALIKSGDSTLRYVTTMTSQALVAATTVNIPAWDIELADPS